MAQLYFKVGSDWEEVVRLRAECEKLESQLKKMDSTKAPASVAALETQLGSAKQKMNELVSEAAIAGSELDGNFKKKIFNASTSVNDLSQKIITQKGVIEDIKKDIRDLSEEYKKLTPGTKKANAVLGDYNSAKKVLQEEKTALFDLTQQQAEARLSVKQLRDEYALYKNDSKDVININDGLGISLKKAIGVIGGAAMLESLVSSLISVRGEFELMDTAIETLLGSKEKADALMIQVRQFAKISPLDLKSVSSATQMMLGFNIEAEKVPRFLRAIGDISMGEAGKFNSLTLAFSQMSAIGKLTSQDLNQMVTAGFNPLSIMAEKTGKSIEKLKEEISKGAISAEMVQQAFIDATEAGGKFYNMSENAAKTVNGQLSMLQDAIDAAFNEVGTKSQDVIITSIQSITKLVENYETIGKILVGLITTYGAYKTAVFLATQAENGHSLAMLVARTRILATQKAQALLNATMLKNPYVAVAVALGTIATAVWAYSSRLTEAEKAQERLNNSIKEAEKASLSEQRELAKLKGELSALEKGTDEYNAVKNKIISNYSKYYDGLEKEIEAVGLTEAAYDKLTAAITKSFSARQYEKFTQEQTENLETIMSDNLGKIQDRLIDKLGEEAGTKYYTNIRKAILDGTIGAGTHLGDKITGIDEETSKALDKVSGHGNFISNHAIEEYIKEILRAQRLTERLDEKARIKFGIDDSSSPTPLSSDEKKDSDPLYSVDYEKAKKEWEKAKEELEAIKKDREKFTTKQYEDAKKAEEETKKKYASLGGKTDKELSKENKEADNLKKQQDKYNSLLEKQNIESKRKMEDLQNEVEQARIDAMEDGNQKTLSQMKLNHKKELEQIDREKEDLLQRKKDNAKALFEANPANKGKTFNGSGIKLTEEEEAVFTSRLANSKQAQINEHKKHFDTILEQYQDFTARRKSLDEKYDKEVKELNDIRNEENSEEVERTLKEAERRHKVAIKSIDNEEAALLNKTSTLFMRLFSDVSYMSSQNIKKVIADTKILLNYLNKQSDIKPEGFTDEQLALIKDPEKIKAIYDELIEKQNELDSRSNYMFSDLVKGFKKVKESVIDLSKAEKALTEEERKRLQISAEQNRVKGFEYLKKGAVEATSSISIAIEKVKELAKATGNVSLESAADQAGALMQNLNAAASGAQSGGWIGAIIGGASDIIAQTVDGYVQLKIQEEEARLALINYYNELELIKLRIKEDDGIFGKNAISDAAEAYRIAQEALEKYNNELNKSLEIGDEVRTKNNKGLGLVLGLLTGDAVSTVAGTGTGLGDHVSNQFKQMQDALEKGYNALEGMSIKTKDYNGWQEFWGKEDEFKSLKDVAPELWEDGEFNIENAKAFLETNKQLTDEQRAQIQNVIDLKEAYDAAMEVVRAEIADTFGYLGEDLSDLITNSIKNGTNAWEDFKNVGVKALETLGDKLVYELFLSKKLEQLGKDLEKAYENGGSAEEIAKKQAEILDNYFNVLEGDLKDAQKFKEDWRNRMSEKGYDVYSSDSNSNSSTKRGFETMTQDQAGELNGRFTALQMAGEEIKMYNAEQSRSLLDIKTSIDFTNIEIGRLAFIADDTRNFIVNCYLELQEIKENTGAIIKPINQMAKDIEIVKQYTSRL